MINKKYLLNLGFFFLLYNTTFIDTVQAFPACDGTEDECMVIIGKPPPEDSFTPGDGGGSSWGGGGGGGDNTGGGGNGGSGSNDSKTITNQKGCEARFPVVGTSTRCKEWQAVCKNEVGAFGTYMIPANAPKKSACF